MVFDELSTYTISPFDKLKELPFNEVSFSVPIFTLFSEPRKLLLLFIVTYVLSYMVVPVAAGTFVEISLSVNVHIPLGLLFVIPELPLTI